jgi:hypothetical protein
MCPSPRTAQLYAALERAEQRLAEAQTLLHTAAETRALAWIALERSRLLLAEAERSKTEERLASTPSQWPSMPCHEDRDDQDLSR